MRKIFFHIGHGKTGSSHLQSCFALSRDALKIERIHYPLSGKETTKALAGHISMGNFPPPRGYDHHPDEVFSLALSNALAEIGVRSG